MLNYTFLAALNISIPDYKNEILIENFKIRKRTKAELLEYYNIEEIKINKSGSIDQIKWGIDSSYNIHWMFRDLNGANCEYYIEYNLESDNTYFDQQISTFLRAFRFFKEGKIEIPVIFKTDLKHFQNIKLRLVREENLFELYLEELPTIIKLYNKLKEINNLKFNLIIERFENAISINTSSKNAFIDLVIILESILLQNEKDELRFRFSLLLSIVLTQIGFQTTFKEIQRIYDVRSSIAHSGDAKDFSDEYFNMILGYTRSVIKWYIDQDLNNSKAREILFEKLNLKYK